MELHCTVFWLLVLLVAAYKLMNLLVHAADALALAFFPETKEFLAIWEEVETDTMNLSLLEFSDVAVAIGLCELSEAVEQVVFPVAEVDISIGE